ncbi:hypothetical protein GRX03_14725 [Halovenus sp. WSH3]|uniref:DUF445 family protein n=1 Tax=Halovenus carboxidivorans TaxID=2692199 RepID=A0A6B0T446_9EURY|nr:hypothetical protein [Halovenus carboxidivorans]MXR52855.1 hypothetical protein [Halovenus carboxidivorans]
MLTVIASAVSSLPALQWRLLAIPLITGLIGYGTNWVAIRLLFYPTDFVGVSIPGLKELAPTLPRRIQQIPGVVEGRVGWQGIIPSRSARMGTIAAEKGIAKIGTEAEFYERFDPDRIAAHIVTESREEIRDLTADVIESEYPELWHNMPESTREFIHARVEDRLPRIAEQITDSIGTHIDELLDINRMIADHLDEHPDLINRIFLEVGDRELTFIVNSGLYIGTFLGVFSIPLFLYIDAWWVLPACGIAVGYLTNWIALNIIFRPIREYRIGPLRLQGLFIKRQPTAAEKYAEIVADEIVTIGNIADNLMHGSQSDRTRKMIRDAIRPEVDRSVGLAAPIIRMTTGDEQYERLREAFAEESVEQTIDPLQDPEFNAERSEAIEGWMADRIKRLPPEGFVELLRPAFEEDEWMLILLGAVLGFVAGWLQLLVVNAL